MADVVYYLASADEAHEAAGHEAPATTAHEGQAAAEHDGGHGKGPMDPSPNLMIWTLMAFLLVLAGIYRLLPKILAAIDERTQKIAGDIQGAEKARSEAEKLQAEYQQQLADARAEARSIVDAARQEADAQRRDILAKAHDETSALKQKAQEEIENEKARAVKELRAQIADLSCSVASRVVNETITPATHSALIDRFIEEIGSGDGRAN